MCLTKRKISGGTMSEAGYAPRDVLLGLVKNWLRAQLDRTWTVEA